MKIVMFSAQPYDERSFDEVLQRDYAARGFELVYQKAALSLQTVALAQGGEAVCAFVNDQLDAPVLETLHGYGVRAILLRCAGFNHIDLEAARRLGLFVARVPAYSPEAVAEHAIALILTLNRHTHRAYNRVREGNFMLDGLLGFNLHGKTVGVVGTGKIGLATARILKGFGCRVLGYDPYPTDEFAALGEYVALDVLLAESDVVSLHCPLSDATRHLISAASLARIKHGAMLVNTSRGGLIDTRAVIAALKSRRLSALAIDVYEQESQLFFHDRSSDIIDDDVFTRLMTFPNVIVTGHQGFFTVEALREIAETTLHNLDCYAGGRSCGNVLAGNA
ncbi:2-hydroxyacid dehydrogenase [Azotobacter chroococcum]|uniref:D-isomer specific 2-hydroxyacid dehydrogenase, NAD binding domain n=1 Tax=Azotobacter chroococcum NCIMB 8003 TaxID=1328314 RepID=A0A0C4WT90_9GAMM|nr:2-hydroxyacid dehydrogenase [Azotobacter chroococcum]AJE22830.1 D-isomer specific 2-hydroxyacid dehydrogenase, NAD binding domain [Azotobacter chroococcum NCIMB 8003]